MTVTSLCGHEERKVEEGGSVFQRQSGSPTKDGKPGGSMASWMHLQPSRGFRSAGNP
jgi:hypothetical protein